MVTTKKIATECSTVCGNGTQTVTRTCLYGEPGEGECLGADMYTEICHNLPCKVISIIYFLVIIGIKYEP